MIACRLDILLWNPSVYGNIPNTFYRQYDDGDGFEDVITDGVDRMNARSTARESDEVEAVSEAWFCMPLSVFEQINEIIPK